LVTVSADIAVARAEAERARARLMASAHELQERLSPKVLARDTWEGAKSKGADLVEDAVDAVKARPLATTGVIAAITMFLARGPLMDLAGQLVDGISAKKTKQAKKTTPRRAPRKKLDKTETVQ
jgi:ElaB/YqjD/DUF883 family membrane-anchored ribosome-binding protein